MGAVSRKEEGASTAVAGTGAGSGLGSGAVTAAAVGAEAGAYAGAGGHCRGELAAGQDAARAGGVEAGVVEGECMSSEGKAAEAKAAAAPPPPPRSAIVSRFERADKRTNREVRSVLTGLIRQIEVRKIKEGVRPPRIAAPTLQIWISFIFALALVLAIA